MQQTIKADTGWRIWWQLTRPHTLTAAFAPVFLGTMIALTYGKIHFPLFFAMLIASIFIQMATNMFNEYYDFKRGLDTEQSIGIGGTIVRNGVKPKTVLNLAFMLYGISVLIGIYICMETSWMLAVVGSPVHDDWLLLYRRTVSNRLHAIWGTVFRRCHGNATYPNCILYSDRNSNDRSSSAIHPKYVACRRYYDGKQYT